MKRTIFKIEIDDEFPRAETTLEFTEPGDMIGFCQIIDEVLNKHDDIRKCMATVMIKSRLERMIEDIKNEDDQEYPDFDKILKNAKIDDSNKNIKEN